MERMPEAKTEQAARLLNSSNRESTLDILRALNEQNATLKERPVSPPPEKSTEPPTTRANDPITEQPLSASVLDALRATAEPITAEAATPAQNTSPQNSTLQPITETTPSAIPNPATQQQAAGPAPQSWAAMSLRLKTSDVDYGGFNRTQDVVSAPSPPPSSITQAAEPKIETVIAPAATTTQPSPSPPAPINNPEIVTVASGPAGPSAEPVAVEEIEAPPADTSKPPETTIARPQSIVAHASETPHGRPGLGLMAPAPPPIAEKPASRIAVRPIDPNEPETLSYAILSALEKNPEIQIAEAQRDEALFGVDESRAAMLPSVSLSAGQGRERRTTQDDSEQAGLNTRSEFTVSLRQNLFDFGAANDSLRSAASVAQSAEWSYRGQIDQVALRIAATFHQLAERQAIVALAEQNLAAHEVILRTVQTQREFGMVTGADVSRIDARLNAAKSELADRRSAMDQAREDYRRLLDRAPGVMAPPKGLEALIPDNVDEAVRLTPTRNPQVMQARLLVDSLHQQRAAQQSGALPRFDIELEGARRNNVGGETGRSEEARAMINMRMPLLDGGARQAGVNRLTARIRQARFQVERAERDAEQAVRNDYTALNAAKGKTASIEAEVAAAERLVTLYQEQFRTGSRSVFDLLDSQSTLYQAQIKRESNRTEVRMSAYRVLSTLGSLVQTVTQADNVAVRLFPASEPTRIRSARPNDGFSPR